MTVKIEISVLWPNSPLTIEMKQNQTFFHGKHSNLISFFIGCEMLNHFNYFCKRKQKQVKWKIKQGMTKSPKIFSYLLSIAVFQWLLKFISWWGLIQKWIITVLEKKWPSLDFTL